MNHLPHRPLVCRPLALLGVIAIISGCSYSADSSATSQPAVSLATAQYRSIQETITATGRVGSTAGTQTKLAFLVPGVVQSIDAHVGERVSTGQALAQLDTSGLSLSAQQAQANAQAAAATAQQAAVDRTSTQVAVDQAALQRANSLYVAGISARKDIEAAQAQLAADRAQAESNLAALHAANAQSQSATTAALLAQRDLVNGTLRAPMNGVVAAILHREGANVDTSTPVIAIAPSSDNTVTLDVAASDAARVHPGDTVHLTTAGAGTQSIGRVAGVSTALDPTTQTATVDVTGVPPGVLAGTAVQATIDVATLRGIIVPETAIVQDPQTGSTFVFVQTADKDGTKHFAQRTVHIAFDNGTNVLISNGLRPGEPIAVQGGFALLAPAANGN